MAISFPVTMPTTPAFKSVVFNMISVTRTSISPFTGQQQVTVYPGQWWEANVTLPPMQRAQAEEWLAFLASLNGHEGYFLFGDPDGTTPRGTANGTPLVKGTDQTGQDLLTDGWAAAEEVLKAGDYVQVENNLYKVLADVTSDGSGNATVSLFPKIRSAHADNAALTLSSAKGYFRLKNPTSSWNADSLGIYGLSFSLMERV